METRKTQEREENTIPEKEISMKEYTIIQQNSIFLKYFLNTPFHPKVPCHRTCEWLIMMSLNM
jgi:hypothetical protein